MVLPLAILATTCATGPADAPARVTSREATLLAVSFTNANEWESYFSVHNVRAALSHGQGQGVKVGILDSSFGYDEHSTLYEGCVDFVNDYNRLHKDSWHGYWMATTLKEIAPQCKIYALNAFGTKEKDTVAAMVRAIDWSILNGIGILTYSGPQFSKEGIAALDVAVDRALSNGIVTTFIHYDHPGNLKPGGLFSFGEPGERAADVDILHYDYNTLLTSVYSRYANLKETPESGNDVPYFSISSTSVVTAGFVAILRSIVPSLSAAECKRLLVSTSKSLAYYDPFFRVWLSPKHVADIGSAVEALLSRN